MMSPEDRGYNDRRRDDALLAIIHKLLDIINRLASEGRHLISLEDRDRLFTAANQLGASTERAKDAAETNTPQGG